MPRSLLPFLPLALTLIGVGNVASVVLSLVSQG